ncbi:MAG TPA: group 1 truncated hemoglobin [Bryobacteraceae bacterium]|jgi:hemoglobin|nr:group 1 truncated hemoglobin [Bryobacteraceae bacterium]
MVIDEGISDARRRSPAMRLMFSNPSDSKFSTFLVANSPPAPHIIDAMTVLKDTPELPLYKRLGGYDAIAAIVDDLFARLAADARFSRFAMGRSMDSHQRARQLLVDQLCSLSGGPCHYIGRDMKTSHAGLGITESEWAANLELTREVLESKGLESREQAECFCLSVAKRISWRAPERLKNRKRRTW